MAGPRRHHERTRGPDSVPQRGDQALRATLDRADGTKRGVGQEHVARPHAEGAELPDQLAVHHDASATIDSSRSASLVSPSKSASWVRAR